MGLTVLALGVKVVWIFAVTTYTHPVVGYGNSVLLGRVVMPTQESCEAARRGVEDYEAGEPAARLQAEPCEPVPPAKPSERWPE